MPAPNKYILLKIPTRTYLKKYMQHKLGEVFFSDGHHHIQKFLTALLQKKVYNYNFTNLNTQYRDFIHVQLSHNAFKNTGFGISQQHTIDFNNYVEMLFDDDLVNFCRDHLKFHEVCTKSIFEFAEMYGIEIRGRRLRSIQRGPDLKDALYEFARIINLDMEVDISFETLKKMEYRARMRRNPQEINFLQPVPKMYNGQLQLAFS